MRVVKGMKGGWFVSTVRNAKIVSTFIGREDHGIPTLWIHLEGAGWGQGFGGRDMRYKDYLKDIMVGVLDTLEVKSWEDLRGVSCRVWVEDGMIVKLGHYLKEHWVDGTGQRSGEAVL